MLYADSQAFLNHQAIPPLPHSTLPQHLQLALVTAANPWSTTTEEVLAGIRMTHETLAATSVASIVTTASQFDRERARGQTHVVLGLQSPPHDLNYNRLKEVYAAGVRVMTLGYQDATPYGGGFFEPLRRLTAKGRMVLDVMAELGMILDLSHAGHAMAFDALMVVDELDLAVMASHGGSYSVYEHPRNLPDRILSGIAARAGIVGVYSLTFGLDVADNSFGAMVWHLRHIVELCGPAGVCIGSDAVYQNLNIKEWNETFGRIKQKLDPTGRMGARWPDMVPELNGVDRMARIDQLLPPDFDDFRVGLLGENLWNFFTANL